MEIRGHQYKAAQGIAAITNDTSDKTVIAGIAGKTLYLNYITIGISDSGDGTGELTDGDGGTAFWKQETLSSTIPLGYILDYGEYGLALTEGNGLFATTSVTTLDYVITALGYYK
tara:strand:- start:747 stop:1091 length:345 start_codon:yes stop_codon:yes gene_type:complete